MLAEIIMEAHGFDAVWHVTACSPESCMWPALVSRWIRSPWPLGFLQREGGIYVGTWTGPDRDLICVRDADTNDDAEIYLSPSGRTILTAAVKAAWKHWRTRPGSCAHLRTVDQSRRKEHA